VAFLSGVLYYNIVLLAPPIWRRFIVAKDDMKVKGIDEYGRK